MNPLVLSLLCALGALGLIAYSVLDKDNKLFSFGQRSEKPLPMPVMSQVNELAVERLEQQIISLEAESEKLALERRSLQEQLESAKKIESGLRGELESFKQVNAEKLKDSQSGSEEALVLKEKLAAQEKKTTELTDKISGLEAQVNEYKTALKSQASALEEFKAKPAQAVPSPELEGLKKQTEELKLAIAKYKEKEDTTNKDLDALKLKLAEREAALKKVSGAPVQSGISPEDYNRLKEKLEQAEGVLRILHAADK
ncbi:MAG: hypothetical protein NTY47_00260 [Candidatus Omnitrophica bacterium]|nr:hypothetical protein [Candidatus Omnitrophota bacterium]